MVHLEDIYWGARALPAAMLGRARPGQPWLLVTLYTGQALQGGGRGKTASGASGFEKVLLVKKGWRESAHRKLSVWAQSFLLTLRADS